MRKVLVFFWVFLFGVAQNTSQTINPQTIHIDVRGAARPFPHVWEQMFGSGRAVLSLRESYRDDLRHKIDHRVWLCPVSRHPGR